MSFDINISITTTITCDLCGFTREFECDDVDLCEEIELQHAGFVKRNGAILCEDCADPDTTYIGFVRKFGEEHLYGVCAASTCEEVEQGLDDYVASVDIEIADVHIAKTHEIRVCINNRYYRPAKNAIWEEQ